MTFPELTEYLAGEGVRLALYLDADGPEAALTDEVVDAIRTHKPLLCEALARDLLWQWLEPLRWGPALLPEDDPDRDRDEPPGILAGV